VVSGEGRLLGNGVSLMGGDGDYVSKVLPVLRKETERHVTQVEVRILTALELKAGKGASKYLAVVGMRPELLNPALHHKDTIVISNYPRHLSSRSK
jgi:hypothetical protein